MLPFPLLKRQKDKMGYELTLENYKTEQHQRSMHNNCPIFSLLQKIPKGTKKLCQFKFKLRWASIIYNLCLIKISSQQKMEIIAFEFRWERLPALVSKKSRSQLNKKLEIVAYLFKANCKRKLCWIINTHMLTFIETYS